MTDESKSLRDERDPAKSLKRLLEDIGVVAEIPGKMLAEILRSLKTQKAARSALTDKELTEIVNKPEVSTKCTEYLLTECKGAFDQQEDRRRSIDAKSAALAGLISGSIVLLISRVFDSGTWGELEKLTSRNLIVGLFAVGLAALAVAAAAALMALMVRSFEGPNEENYFNPELLDDPERLMRSQAVHFCAMQSANSAVNDKKAAWLFVAQCGYAGFLAMIVAVGIILAIGLWK